MSNITYSVIIPVFNEEGAILRLLDEIDNTMKILKDEYEVIVVNDGSTDKTKELVAKSKRVKLINLRRNFGQSTALNVGIKKSTGKIIITLDGDGQNDPADIPKLLNLLAPNIDFVCGWRKSRVDSVGKKIVSAGAGYLRKLLVKDGVSDAGCTLRVYRRQCFEDFILDGEMHRMIPAILNLRGFISTECEVNHRGREFGTSKYGVSRITNGLLDMLLIWFEKRFKNRPIHLFGGVGVLVMFVSSTLLLMLGILRLFYNYQLSEKIWPLVGVMGFITGLQLVVFGVLADLIRRNKSQGIDWMIKNEDV